MARRPSISKEAADLLALTLRAAKSKIKEFEKEGIPLDAATISASVSLLKLTEAYQSATRDDSAAELERLRLEFEASKQQRQSGSPSFARTSEIDPDELRRSYGLEDESP
ncbi:hypothetical protein D3C84_308880 [compost metagenome]